MNQSNIHLLDLPNEILIIILRKLDNIDVLYSLFGIRNKRIDPLIEDNVFINILDFTKISSIIDLKLNRFCTSILPQKHHSIKKLILNTESMERILLAGDYPNLTSLELFDFREEIVSRYLTDNSIFRHIFKEQITDLILRNNDEYIGPTSLKTYIPNVYEPIIVLFEHLKHFRIVPLSVDEYPPLFFGILQPTVHFSSNLTILCIAVYSFDDCLTLLDGRLKQLTTFIVEVKYIAVPVTTRNKDDLHNLKCFSLTSYDNTSCYHHLVVPLLRRMTNLEKLTLYLRIGYQNTFIDGTNIYNEFLIYMPDLHTFIFYISAKYIISLTDRESIADIQQRFKNIKYGQTACIMDYYNGAQATCHIYSLPFTFTRLGQISNHFPSIVFGTVTHLHAYDMIPMKHEFFMRISQAFPLLKCFSLNNQISQSVIWDTLKSEDNSSYSVIEYSHLMSLNILDAHTDYVEQFLLETKTHIPRLTELIVNYTQLKTVTMDFTRDATRRNCSNVKRLIRKQSARISKALYQYFPSL